MVSASSNSAAIRIEPFGINPKLISRQDECGYRQGTGPFQPQHGNLPLPLDPPAQVEKHCGVRHMVLNFRGRSTSILMFKQKNAYHPTFS